MVAEQLAREGGGLAGRRRAVSTAYYAVFHALARLCADELLGSDSAARETEDYERVYRALEHKSMKAVFESKLKDIRAFREIGDRVVSLQSKRHDADYRPSSHHVHEAEIHEILETARSIVNLIDLLPARDRRTLAVRLIIRNRNA